MDYSLVGGQKEKRYEPWNWRFNLAVLSVILLIVSIILISINPFDETLLMTSSILVIIAAVLIPITTLDENKLTVGEINNNILLVSILASSVYILLYLSKITTNSGIFLQAYVIQMFGATLATITSAIMIYFS